MNFFRPGDAYSSCLTKKRKKRLKKAFLGIPSACMANEEKEAREKKFLLSPSSN